MDALAFLDSLSKAKRQPIYALSGEEDFLKRRCREAIVKLAVGDGDPDFAVGNYSGDGLDFSTVRNELDTLAFLAPVRIVIVDTADKFVTENRESLERYAAAPSKLGVLILEVKSFPETTRLAKALPDAAKLACKSPVANRLPDWCRKWCKAGHGKTLAGDAAEALIELVGPAMGMLDQELEKLAVAIGTQAEIALGDVERLVGRSRGADVFKILDAVGDGKPQVALNILGQLFQANEPPIKLLAALAYGLRQLSTIGKLLAQGQSLGPAMDAAGVPRNWADRRNSTERQVKHLGRNRLLQISDWLVEIDLGLKGGNPLPEQLQFERLIVRLARSRG